MTYSEKLSRMLCASLLAATLAGCAGPRTPGGIYDPYEAQNRKVHEFNRSVDKALLRPVSNAYGAVLPEPVRIGVGNFAENLSIPGSVLNDLLQLNIEDALHNTVRFLVNTTVGLGGILDPATKAGIEQRDSDFGETLHVWGFKEGAYVELPFAGPSTTRDTVGMVVDIVTDPVAVLLPEPEKYVAPLAGMASKIGDRYRFRTTVDSILYESADGYAQARLLYLENRRFALGSDTTAAPEDSAATDVPDIYEGLYDDLVPQ